MFPLGGRRGGSLPHVRSRAPEALIPSFPGSGPGWRLRPEPALRGTGGEATDRGVRGGQGPAPDHPEDAPGGASQDLGGPRAASDQTVRKVAAEYRDWCSSHPDYDPKVAREAVSRGTQLVKVAGNWERGVSALREVWVERFGNHLQDFSDPAFESLLEPGLLEFLREAAQTGVRARHPHPQTRWRVNPPPVGG